jgi:hypothetical protein
MLLIVVLLAATVWGCATTKEIPFDRSAVANLTGKEVIVVKRLMPDFMAVTRSGMSVGLVPFVGGFIRNDGLISAGNSLVQENDIGNPAYEIADKIGRSMAIKHGTKYIGVDASVVSNDAASVLAVVYSTVPLVLDVKTINWGLVYFTVFSDTYRAFYIARLRVIDTSTSSILAEGECRSIPDRKGDALSYDALVENRAVRLKEKLKEAAQFCIQEFSSKLGM